MRANLFREMMILSDGRVTTRCVDNEGSNSCASIFHHDIHEVVRAEGDRGGAVLQETGG